MCIIIYNENGRPHNRDHLSTAYDNNPHGAGIMWVEKGKVRTVRGLWTKDRMMAILEDFRDVPHAIHLRWRTRGKISEEMCHPFRASAKRLPDRVYLMHNGTIGGLKTTGDQSDTFAFAQGLRTATGKHGTDILFTESFLRRLEKEIQNWNKVIFLRDDGKVAIVNPNKWHVEDGFWYSNTYSLKKGYREDQNKPLKQSSSLGPGALTWRNGGWEPANTAQKIVRAERATVKQTCAERKASVMGTWTPNSDGVHYVGNVAFRQVAPGGAWVRARDLDKHGLSKQTEVRVFGDSSFYKGGDGIWRKVPDQKNADTAQKTPPPGDLGVDHEQVSLGSVGKRRKSKKQRKEARRRSRRERQRAAELARTENKNLPPVIRRRREPDGSKTETFLYYNERS